MQQKRPFDHWVMRGFAFLIFGLLLGTVLWDVLGVSDPTTNHVAALTAPQRSTSTPDPNTPENEGGPDEDTALPVDGADGLKPLAIEEHPMSITAMRQRTYPGSTITFEETLDPGTTYNQYVVSYLSEGNKIFALMSIPFGQRPATGWPVVVFNHGYIPPTVYRTTERYVDYFAAFANAGYITFKSDYRGHGFSEGNPGGAYSSPDYVVDVLNAVASLKAYPDADANRMGMWGHSMGGYITLRAMVIDPSIKAGVIWGGVVASYPDLFTLWWRPREANNDSTITPERRRWRDRMIEDYGTPEENPEFWNAISANSYLADLSGPIQLHHSTTDETVPIAMSDVLYGQILEAGGLVEYYQYIGDDHDITYNLYTALARSVAFFDVWVKGT